MHNFWIAIRKDTFYYEYKSFCIKYFFSRRVQQPQRAHLKLKDPSWQKMFTKHHNDANFLPDLKRADTQLIQNGRGKNSKKRRTEAVITATWII